MKNKKEENVLKAETWGPKYWFFNDFGYVIS